MMKMRVSELIGAQLDWAVAKCIGRGYPYPASINWAVGGPIIEREQITVGRADVDGIAWTAWMRTDIGKYYGDGPTPLIAAMRCYVSSKLGDEVEIPEELL